MPKQRVKRDAVFLNIPYDARFESLYLAYIVGLTTLGLVPRATLAIPGGQRRLERIFDLVKTCKYSVHDLSRVQLSPDAPKTPRFNMPFELGLAVAWAMLKPTQHVWFAYETLRYRPLKSLSDLNGTDFHIHGGTVEGVMRELCNAFVRHAQRPTVPLMMSVYRRLRKSAPQIVADAGANSVFEARVFAELSLAAGALSRTLITP